MARRSDHTRPELKALALQNARKIVREDGVATLSTRKLAARIGYTSGTIYQIFRNRDDLIEQMNSETLELLYQHCRTASSMVSVKSRLRHLAKRFVSFANEYRNEWDAVISYRFAPDFQMSEFNLGKVDQLMALLREAISELYGTDEEEQLVRDAQVLWNSLYGVFSLAISGRLGLGCTIDEAADDLIELYLAARG